MTNKEREEIFKAINNVSCRVNEVSQKLDEFIRNLNDSATEKITINSSGIDDMASIIASHNTAINDLATTITKMELKETTE